MLWILFAFTINKLCGPVVNTVTSLQEGPLFKSTACPGVSVWSLLFHVCVGSLWVTRFLPTIQRHAGIGARLIGYSKLPKGVSVSTVTDWLPPFGSWDKLHPLMSLNCSEVFPL